MSRNFDVSFEKFSGLNLSLDREHTLSSGESCRMQNFCITDAYKLKKRSGFEVLVRNTSEGRGITAVRMKGVERVVYVVGREVYCYSAGTNTLIGQLESDSGEVDFLYLSEKLYFLDGVKIKVWDGETFQDINPYRPLVAISTTPSGAGVAFEETNCLTGKVRQSFSPTQNAQEIYLPVIPKSVDYVKVGGVELSKNNYTVNFDRGTVTVSCAGETMLLPDSLEIGYTVKEENKVNIHSFRHAVCFGGDNDTRVFLWGSANMPNTVYYSSAVNGMTSIEYFPENNFNTVGTKGEITSVLRHYDRLVIFLKGESFYSYQESRVDDNGVTYNVFPTRPLSDSIGCSTPNFARLIDNFPVTLDRHSLYKWVDTSIRDERYAVNIGERIRRGIMGWDSDKIRSFDSDKTHEFFIWQGDEIYVYNYMLDVFYFWCGFESAGFCALEDGKIMFVSKNGSLCIMNGGANDDGHAVKCVWETPYLEYAKGVKNLQSVFVEVYPDISTRLNLFWVSDHATSGKKSFFEHHKRFTFEKLDFNNLGFKTGKSPNMFFSRIKHKRFEKMKLRIESEFCDSHLHVLSLRALGVVSDKK